MRAKARTDLGVAADCVLATFGVEVIDDPSDTARAYTGAILLLEALGELRIIREMLTPKEKNG